MCGTAPHDVGAKAVKVNHKRKRALPSLCEGAMQETWRYWLVSCRTAGAVSGM